MSTAPVLPATRSSTGSPTVRAFLRRYTATLLPPLAVLVGLGLIGLGRPSPVEDSWPVAVAVTAGWGLAVAAWLTHRGWDAGTAHAVTWAPVAVLAAPAGLGWLSAPALVLWGPVGTVLAVALTTALRPPEAGAPAARPPESDNPSPGSPPGSSEEMR